LAVIMVSDLVGSTALRSRLGGDRFERLRQEHDALLRDGAEDGGGRVVKGTGDGFLVAFPSVGGALDAAVAIQQGLERRNRSAEVAMMVRIGISVGDASVEDGDYFGVSPIEAARLCCEASGGEILVADPIRAVQRGAGVHPLEEVGALPLKGLPEPVVAWRVAWTPLPSAARALLPQRLRGAPEVAHVGRGAEQELLAQCWGRTLDGARQVVFVSGEPGVGKTQLVTQLARNTSPSDALILYGRCDEDQGIAFYPWLEVLRDFVQVAPRRLLRPHASELSRLIPGLNARLGAVSAPLACDPPTERHLLFRAVQSLVAAAAERAPVLLILDDLQWADRESLLLLKHLASTSGIGRLMVLGTFRDSDVGPDDQLTALLADLHRESGVTRLRLGGLDEIAIVDWMVALAGQPIDSAGLALAGEIHRETAGNPFFIDELLRHMGERGGTAPLRGAVPVSVREVIQRRVHRLGDEARQILSAAAVVGVRFDSALVVRAVDLPAGRVLDLLDEAIAAGLLRRTAAGVYAFVHGLVQGTLKDGLPAGRRAALTLALGAGIDAGSVDRLGPRPGQAARRLPAEGVRWARSPTAPLKLSRDRRAGVR